VLITMSWKSWLWRAVVFLLMFGVVVWLCPRIQPPWWDHARDVAEMLAAHKTRKGYEGVDEYVPAGADAYNTQPDAPLVSLNTGEPLVLTVQRWDAEKKIFSAQASHSGLLALHLFNYPAWRVELNGQKVEVHTHQYTGQMLIPVVTGDNEVRITFTRTWDRTVGMLISLVTAAILLVWFVKDRLHQS
jgi:hypothetical protein